MNKHIAIISFHTCPLASQEGKESGGMNVYVLEIARSLVTHGYKVDIFTRIQDVISPEIVDYEPNLRIIHLKAGPKHHINKKKLIKYIDEFTIHLHTYITKNSLVYSLFDCHYYLSGMVAFTYNKKYQTLIPYTVNFHTLALMKNLVARNPKEKESQQRIEDELLLTKNANHIISSSINDKEYLTHLYSCPENKITAINPGVDTDLFKPIDKNTALQFIHSVTHNKIVTFVGRIEALKGIDVLMYAIKIIHDRNPDLKVALLIVGGYSNRINNKELIRLKKLQNTLKMSPIVGFIDQRPQQELPYYYNASELVVTPSHYESFGMTSLEAMACGTPVLITDTSGISSMLNDDFKDLLISANNPLLLASHIEEILKNDSYKKQFKLKILKRINKFSWKNVAIKTDEVYQSIINKTS